MLATFKDLIIEGKDLQKFVDTFEDFFNKKFKETVWILDNHDEVFFIENEALEATVCLVYQNFEINKKIEVTNVIPTNRHALTVEKYNNVLDKFNEDILKIFINEKKLNIEIKISSGQISLTDVFGQKAVECLFEFIEDIKGLKLKTIQENIYINKKWFKFILLNFYTGRICYNDSELQQYFLELFEDKQISDFFTTEYLRTITFLSYYEDEFKSEMGR